MNRVITMDITSDNEHVFEPKWVRYGEDMMNIIKGGYVWEFDL